MSIEDIYKFSCSIGFKRQFLDNFGSRAADVQKWQANEREGVFWINLIQQLLCAALVREGVHLKLQVTEGIEVMYLPSSYSLPKSSHLRRRDVTMHELTVICCAY